MLQTIRNAAHETCHWVGGVANCALKGGVSGFVMGATAVSGFEFCKTGTLDVSIAFGLASGVLSAAAGAVICGTTRMMSENAGRKMSAAFVGGLKGSVMGLGVPGAAQMVALSVAVGDWRIESSKIKNEAEEAHARAVRSVRKLYPVSGVYTGEVFEPNFGREKRTLVTAKSDLADLHM